MRARAVAPCLLLDAGLDGWTRGAWRMFLGRRRSLVHVGADLDLNFATWAGRRRSLTGSIDLADSTIADWP